MGLATGVACEQRRLTVYRTGHLCASISRMPLFVLFRGFHQLGLPRLAFCRVNEQCLPPRRPAPIRWIVLDHTASGISFAKSDKSWSIFPFEFLSSFGGRNEAACIYEHGLTCCTYTVESNTRHPPTGADQQGGLFVRVSAANKRTTCFVPGRTSGRPAPRRVVLRFAENQVSHMSLESHQGAFRGPLTT
jgi:hypothetical protein